MANKETGFKKAYGHNKENKRLLVSTKNYIVFENFHRDYFVQLPSD